MLLPPAIVKTKGPGRRSSWMVGRAVGPSSQIRAGTELLAAPYQSIRIISIRSKSRRLTMSGVIGFELPESLQFPLHRAYQPAVAGLTQ